jgi:hypothetical protein
LFILQLIFDTNLSVSGRHFQQKFLPSQAHPCQVVE